MHKYQGIVSRTSLLKLKGKKKETDNFNIGQAANINGIPNPNYYSKPYRVSITRLQISSKET